jgi:tetratricopeptide (TPR) repeat protein
MDISKALQTALQYLQSDSAEKCVELCSNVLAANPGLIEAIYLRGCAAFLTGDVSLSISDLEIVHRKHPEHLHAAYYFGRSLCAAGRLQHALIPLQAAMIETELEVVSRYELAKCLTQLRRRGEAIDHYNAILELQSDNVQVMANLASLLERENRLEEATSQVVKALSVDPANQTAQMTQATVNRRNGDYLEAAQQFRRLASEIDKPINSSIVWNQLGQCLEGMGDWEEAFSAFTESNRILKGNHPSATPDPVGTHGIKTLERIRSWLSDSPVKSWKVSPKPDPGGIAFLVGFPRSGTTLLDSMLSAHPDIEVLEEKGLFAGLHQNWAAPGTLEALGEINSSQIEDARDIYRQEMNQHRRRPERSLVIDKLPLNLAYMFLINRLFPEAPIIFLQRHPLDACISCFSQSFELEATMAYFLDLEDTAQYYNAVMQVAALSIEQISNPLHTMHYEDLVSDPEGQLSGLIGYLALDWNDSVLEYRNRDSADSHNTPSYQQVSQPLHSRSIGKWQHYSKQLAPLLANLQPWVKRFDY